MAYYKGLREYLEALDKAGKLVTITAPINKDTQLVPLVYLQWRGLPRTQHKGFLFTNVLDSRGRKYDIPVAHDVLGSHFSAISLQCRPQEVAEKVAQAIMHPVEPQLVKQGPVQEVVYRGDRLLEKGGMDEIPVPITHPGWDGGPIMSASCWVTKDPETGKPNVGGYRSHVFAPDRLGIHSGGASQGVHTHWQKCRARGIPLPAAIVIGGPPTLTYAGYMKLPYGVNEYAVAGAMAGEPVEMVKCQTVDLEVPANADFVFEGELTTEWLEMEGPHGESPGLVSRGDIQPYLTLKCITHRQDPIFAGPAEIIPGQLWKRLKYDLKLDNILAIGTPPSRAPSYRGYGGARLTVIKLKSNTPQEEVWRALEAFSGEGVTKYVVAVDEDIDVQDNDMVWWALSTRVEPHRDFRIVKYTDLHPLSSSYLSGPEIIKMRRNQFHPDQEYPEASRVLINATMKWPYPPVNIPKKEFMEGALAIWQELGLPQLELKEPWYGYELGDWDQESAEDAERAVKGEYYKTSEMRARKRVKVDLPLGGHPSEAERWRQEEWERLKKER